MSLHDESIQRPPSRGENRLWRHVFSEGGKVAAADQRKRQTRSEGPSRKFKAVTCLDPDLNNPHPLLVVMASITVFNTTLVLVLVLHFGIVQCTERNFVQGCDHVIGWGCLRDPTSRNVPRHVPYLILLVY